ncbi:serine/threonine-protein kinase [Geodermatophilus sp. SYSU D00691]
MSAPRPDTGAVPGERLLAGRYVLTDVLGRGGMGVVWRATDRMLHREVAIKELTFSVGLTEEERRVLRERTLREARAAARLDHPCVTTVYDVVEEDGKPWLVMERVEADSLQAVLEHAGPLSPHATARIGLDLLAALEAAHAAGIVHRDVKPGNVLVERDGHARLTDFGIATTTGDDSLTTNGALIGSPSYMAPERIHGDEPHPGVDLWSLGATLYAAVEGRPPFARGEAMATAMSVVSEHPAPTVRAGPLEPVLRGLLTKDPAQRSTAAQARQGLQAVLAGAEPPAPVPAPAPPPPPVRAEGSVHRFDPADLRELALASRAVLGSMARDALTARRRPGSAPLSGRPPAAPRRRRRFKRRWVVVPVVTALVLTLAALAGVVWLVVRVLGLG